MATLNTQGQVQYAEGEALPVYGSPAYNAALSGQIVPNTVANYGTPIMSTTVLQGNQTQPVVPTPAPTTSVQQFVAGLPQASPLQLAPVNAGVAQQEQSLSAAQKRILELSGKLSGQGAEQLRLEEQRGIPVLNRDIADLTTKIASKQAAFNNAEADVPNGTFGTGAQNARISALRRQEAAELGGLSAVLLAKQGNLEGARAEIDRTLKFQYDPIKQEIENTKTFLELNYQNLTRADKKAADALKIQLDREERNINFIQGLKKTAYDQLIKTGATQAQIEALGRANTADEIGKLFISDVVSNVNPVSYANVKSEDQALVGLLEKYRTFISDKNAIRLSTSPALAAEREGLLSLITAEYKQAKKLGTLDAGVQKLMEGLVGRGSVLSRLSTGAQLKAVDNTLQSFGYVNPGDNLSGGNFFGSILGPEGQSNIYSANQGFVIPNK